MNKEFDIKKITIWVSFIGALLTASWFAIAIIPEMWERNNFVVQIAKDHFQAVVGLPMAALAALGLVMLLEIRSGPIELKLPGFEFKGASGPVVMWVFIFLAISSAIKLVW